MALLLHCCIKQNSHTRTKVKSPGRICLLVLLLAILIGFVEFSSHVDEWSQMGSACAVAHYKYKSLEEWNDRAKAYNMVNSYMSKIKFHQERKSTYFNQSNKVQTRGMLVWARALRQHIQQPLKRAHTRGFLAVATMFRHEDAYLKEWLHWNMIQGVDFFYLYADGGYTNSTRSILQPFVNLGMVKVIDWTEAEVKRRFGAMSHSIYSDGVWRDNLGRSVQNLALVDAGRRFGSKTTWLMKVDVDEYAGVAQNAGTGLKVDNSVPYSVPGSAPGLPLPITGITLREMLSSSYGWYFECPRVLFGPNYHEFKPPGLIIEEYTRSSDSPDNHKSILRTSMRRSDDAGDAHNFQVKPVVSPLTFCFVVFVIVAAAVYLLVPILRRVWLIVVQRCAVFSCCPQAYIPVNSYVETI